MVTTTREATGPRNLAATSCVGSEWHGSSSMAMMVSPAAVNVYRASVTTAHTHTHTLNSCSAVDMAVVVFGCVIDPFAGKDSES